MVACYLLGPWLSRAVRETELKSKELYFRLLYLLWISHGVDCLPICSWTRNVSFNKGEDWEFYLVQPFPSCFPNFLPLQPSHTDLSSYGYRAWSSPQWFFQLLNKGRETKVSLLAPGEFGHYPYMPSLWNSRSVLSVEHLDLQMLLCCLGAAGKVKILWVLLK